MSGPWWGAFGPAVTRVACGGHQHQIRWADGRLTAASHPDAEGELVMAALGGEPPRCVQVVQAWGAHADDLEVLAIGPRSAADEVDAVMPGDDVEALWPGPRAHSHLASFGLWPSPRRPAMFTSTVTARRQRMQARSLGVARLHPVARSRPMIPARGMATYGAGLSFSLGRGSRRQVPAQERAQDRLSELRMLFALGPEFQWRLSGAVAAAWSADRPGHDRAAARPALTAALTGRLAPAAQAWLGVPPDQVEVTAHDGPGWGELAATGDEAQPGLTAALTPGWLARVWAPGLALVAGRLVVEVPQAQWPRARVLALTAPGAEPAPMDVQWTAGQWRPGPG